MEKRLRADELVKSNIMSGKIGRSRAGEGKKRVPFLQDGCCKNGMPIKRENKAS